MPLLKFFLQALLVLCLSGRLSQAAGLPRPPFGATDLTPDPAVAFGKLPSGLRYAVMPNREPRDRVSLRLLIRAGSLQERHDQRGLAHYLEHMAFKGTENFAAGTLVEYFQNLGMSFGPDANAYTTFDRTVYQIELPDSEPQSIADALMVLRDFAARMQIPAAEVETERDIILSEKRTRDSVRFRTALAEFAFLLPETIVAERFPIGAREVIRAIGRDDLLEFYEDWYRPERTFIIVVGEASPQTVSPLIAKHFSDYEARRPEPEAPSPGRVVGRGLAVHLHAEPEAPATRVSIQGVHPLTPRPDTAALRRALLTRSVALQMLTRRLERLTQQADAPFSRGSATAYDLFDLFTNASVDLTTRPETWSESLTAAEQELRRALDFGFHEIELREVRANLLNALEENVRQAPTRRSRALAESLARSLTTGTVFKSPDMELERLRPMLEALTVEQCQAALKELFPAGDRFVFVAGNIDLRDPEASIREVYLSSAALPVDPPEDLQPAVFEYREFEQAGAIIEQRHHADLDIHQVKFVNQVHFNLKVTDFSTNRINLAVRIGSGQLTEPPERPGLAWLASETLIRGGLGAHSNDDLRRIFAGHNVGWRFTVEPDAFVFRGATTPEDLALQLRLLCAYLTDPGFREEALRQASSTFDEVLVSARHTARGVLQDAVARFLAGGDRRFGLPPQEVLSGLNLEDVRAWLAEPLLRDRLEISMVGDTGSVTGAIETVAATLGALPERRREAPEHADRRRIARPAPGTTRRFEFPSRIASGYSVVYWPIPDFWDIAQARRLNVLARVFSDRMRLRIREDMGDAYSAHAVSHPSDTYTDYGWFFGLSSIAPHKAATVAESSMQIARDLRTGDITADEHQRALRPLLTTLRDTVRENDYWLNSVMISAWEHPQRLEWARTMIDDFSSVAVEDLKLLARKYLDPDLGVTVLVIPETGGQPNGGAD